MSTGEDQVDERIPVRGLSAFAGRAADHELERDALASYLGELDAEHGPVPPELVGGYDALWPDPGHRSPQRPP